MLKLEFLDLPNKKFLRPEEVADFFRISIRTVYRWCNTGLLKSVNPSGASKRILRESIIELFERTLE